MFIYVRIVIPVHSLSSKSLNSEVFTHSDFKMPLSFVKIGSVAAIELQFIKKARMKENSNFILKCENIN